ncbi:MAG: hypothetical protein RL398_2446 [Planctomycetota bacterium]
MLPRALSAALLLAATPLFAQANVSPGLDLRLLDTWAIGAFQRAGSYPNGVSAIGAWTTCCNPGSVAIEFQAAMNPNHGFIHYLVVREAAGRLEQISNWSYVKHTFGSNNDPSTCGTCAGPGRFSWVEVGCSDTYANYQAVDHFNLGPPEEVDPWLGTWFPQCSYFDRGDPPVAAGQLCDSVRSLTHTQAGVLNQTVNHQVQVHDADLAVPGASYYWQAGYIVPMEADALRTDNLGSRAFTPTWNGGGWSMTDGATFVPGTVLQRWSGASIASNSNAGDDGRCYVAVKVTGPLNGLYHYEYAVHNRDNAGGIAAFRVPVCGTAQVTGIGFHDIDQDPLNEWVGAKVGDEIVWSTGTNPLRWNSLYNFWFDSDAAPIQGTAVTLDQATVGSGALNFTVASSAPLGLYQENVGPGCALAAPPRLYGIGAPPRASLGNAAFYLRATGMAPASLGCFVLTTTPGTLALGGGCTLYSASFAGLLAPYFATTNVAGAAMMPLPIPSSPVFEGLDLVFQAAGMAANGPYLGAFELSNGLRVRVGSAIAGCPQ